MPIVELAQLVTKLQMTIGKRSGTHGSPPLRFAREGVGYLYELGDAVDLRGRDRHDVEAVSEQGIAPPGVARLLMPFGMEGTTVVLRRNTSLRPQQIAHHSIAPRDARRFFRKSNGLVSKCRRQAQTASTHRRKKQRGHFRFFHRCRFRADE